MFLIIERTICFLGSLASIVGLVIMLVMLLA